MFNLFDKKTIQYLALVILVVFLIEFVFLKSNHMIWIIICGVISYFSWQYYYRQEYRVFFWLGIAGMGLALLNTMFFRVLLVFPVLWLAFYIYQNISDNKKEPEPLQFGQETLEDKEVLYSNQWFGKQNIGEKPYHWQDINSQTLFGETIIDLTQTVLPKGEPIILVRHLAGTIKIIIPYDVEVSIHHSVFIGSVDIFGYGDDQVTNRVIHYQTENYQEANQRVKIYTTMLAGKIEVSRG